MRPLLVHLTSYRFAPASHPGVYRTVRALEGLATNVVLSSEATGYLDDDLDEEALRGLAARDVHVYRGALRGVKKPWLARHLAVGLRRRFGRPTALVGHLGNNGWRAILLGRAVGAPIVTVFHGTDVTVDLPSAKYGWRYRRLFASPASHHLAVADHLRDRLREAGAPPDRTATFHLPVDVDSFEPGEPGRTEKPLRLALVGRFIPVKGHETALHALRRVRGRHPDCELHLFGEGPLEKRLRGLAEELGVAEAVRFRGVLPVDALARELRTAHVALQPSVTGEDGSIEGVPNGVLEAMACGIPVVATRHGGIPEAVEDGASGLLVPERDAEVLAAALLALLDDPARRARLGEAARRRVLAAFSMQGQGRALRDGCLRAADAYHTLDAATRREAWRRACDGLADAAGRRQRAQWQLRILANYGLGRIP